MEDYKEGGNRIIQIPPSPPKIKPENAVFSGFFFISEISLPLNLPQTDSFTKLPEKTPTRDLVHRNHRIHAFHVFTPIHT